MAEGSKSGLLDLEKELSCSICTEVLYQPLTLLDCLHTFCGSCLKEWFSWQASQSTDSRPNPYSCPSCRAIVRETRPDAKVTTLLEMFLQANPGRGKTEEEKEGIAQKYKVGDEVMPKIELKRESSADAEDRRMIEEVRDMSLREVGVRGSGTYERGIRRQNRDTDRDTRDDEARQRRREQERRRRQHGEQERPGVANERRSRDADSRSQARQIEHQSSLRSLISNSDVDSAEMEAEILRQIVDEGLLDGIDLNNLDVSQEDELSERIADAYRRRHGQTSRSSETRTEESRDTRNTRTERERPRHREQHRSPPTQQITPSSHPPISRPHLFEAYPTGDGHRRRTSSEHRRQTSPATSTSVARASADTQRQAARSATDLSAPPRTTPKFTPRPREAIRRTSGTRHKSSDSTPTVSSHSRQASASSVSSTQASTVSPRTSDHASRSAPQPSDQASVEEIAAGSSTPPTRSHAHRERTAPYPEQDLNAIAAAPISAPATSRLAVNPYMDTFVSCNRCGKANIAYDLHHNCSICENGRYNLCNRCYRAGKGCLHWYGFGKAAMQKYVRQAPQGGYPPNHPLPHVLRSHRFLDPQIEIRLSSGPRHTIPDPANRLQSGFFCSNCFAFSNSCLWKCDRCNDGEWGFCNTCVNQGICCTHPLLPVAHSSVSKNHGLLIATSHSSLITSSYPQQVSATEHINTACDICTKPIAPSKNRFHCPQCNNGDYDTCSPCYLKLVSTNRISTENGDRGWRKCLQGHRMIIVGFEDHPSGQRRIVIRDLVGGHALKKEESSANPTELERSNEQWRWREEGTLKTAPVTHSTPSNSPSLGSNSPSDSKYPPSGGVGSAAVALWAYWPQEDAHDELGFPKGAEIREASDINGDWFWGIYCGKGGLWPGAYARVIR